jgi:hypothetical protein
MWYVSPSEPSMLTCLVFKTQMETEPLLPVIRRPSIDEMRKVYLSKVGIYYPGRTHPIQHLHPAKTEMEKQQQQIEEQQEKSKSMKGFQKYYGVSLASYVFP